MESIVAKVKMGKVLVSDGAWGTFLQRKGLQPGECPELWNITRREDVLDIAKNYVDAGADMIETNSFGGTSFKLEHYGCAGRVREINRTAAQISREAAGPDRHVIASIGPTGKMLIMGDVTEQQLFDAFAQQATALEDGGADALCIETMSAIDEAVIAVKAAKEATRCEIICTFTFEKTLQDEYRTMMGARPEESVIAARDAGASVIGANCGNGIARMVKIVSLVRKAVPDAPILIHANAGQPQIVDGETVFPETPEQMAGMIADLVKAGAGIVGGCCGTTPAHIRAMKNAVLQV
jgi:5-methyltetrahydrofolate--homocysteine methyltransferase